MNLLSQSEEERERGGIVICFKRTLMKNSQGTEETRLTTEFHHLMSAAANAIITSLYMNTRQIIELCQYKTNSMTPNRESVMISTLV